MLVTLSLAFALQSADSTVAPLEIGELPYSRGYTTWSDVLHARERANLGGFGSTSWHDAQGYHLTFQVYGDSAAQWSQWKRLELLLDAPLEPVQKKPSWAELHPTPQSEPAVLDTGSVRIARILEEDSLRVARHISISDTHLQVPPTQETPSTIPTHTQAEEAHSGHALGTTSEDKSTVMPSTPEPDPSAMGISEPQAKTSTPITQVSDPARESSLSSEASKKPALPPPVVRSAPPKAPDPIPVKAGSKSVPQAANSVTSSPLPAGTKYVLVFGSFSEKANAMRYLARVEETFPGSQIWQTDSMYRVVHAYTQYPSKELANAKRAFGRVWVAPTR